MKAPQGSSPLPTLVRKTLAPERQAGPIQLIEPLPANLERGGGARMCTSTPSLRTAAPTGPMH